MKQKTARNRIVAILAYFAFVGMAHAAEWELAKTIPVGGEGRWDYVTVDADAHRLYVPRSTHVQVIDTESGKVVADWADTPGVHGVAIVPAKQLAFTSNGGSDTVSVFDLKGNKKIADVKTGSRPDAILYDDVSGNVLAFNHKGGTVTFISIDADNHFAPHELEIGGVLEFAVNDGAGRAFVNVEDKNEVVAIDTKAMKVLNRWPLTGGDGPTGLAIDLKKHRLFAGCGGNGKMFVVDSDHGSILATLPIGGHCDGCAFDAESGDAFASCGEGTVAVVRETSDGKFAVAQTIQTKIGARTCGLDPRAHVLYLPTAEYNERSEIKPGTFQILVVTQ